MVQLQDSLVIQQNHIVQLLSQLTVADQNACSERREMTARYFGLEEFTPLEELELLTASIRGYASQIKAAGKVRNCDQAIAQLHSLRVLNSPMMAHFYGEVRSRYPQMQAYTQMLDYLRLLILEYLQMQQEVQPISA